METGLKASAILKSVNTEIDPMCLIGFFKPAAWHPVSPRCLQRLGHFVPLAFTARGGKRQAIRCAAGR